MSRNFQQRVAGYIVGAGIGFAIAHLVGADRMTSIVLTYMVACTFFLLAPDACEICTMLAEEWREWRAGDARAREDAITALVLDYYVQEAKPATKPRGGRAGW